MKSILYVTLLAAVHFLCSDVAIAQSKWEKKISGTTKGIGKVQFVNSLVGYASILDPNDASTDQEALDLLKTTDGGETWKKTTRVPVDSVYLTTPYITNFHFPTSSVGYVYAEVWAVATSTPYFFRTTDGGQSWDKLLAQDVSPVFYFVSKDIGFSTVPGGMGYHYNCTTINGGSSWTKQLILNGNGTNEITMYEMYFPTNKIGYLSTSYGLRRTTDGGLTWNIINFNSAGFYNFTFPNNANEGWSLYLGGVRRTVTGGSQWDGWPDQVLTGMTGINFIDNENGFVVGNGNKIYRSINSGTTWVYENPGITATLNDVSYADSTFCVVVGDGGTILKKKLTMAFSVSDTIDWGHISCGEEERIITITNTGDYGIKINSVNITGSDSANFSIVNFSPLTLGLGASDSIRVRFADNSSGGFKKASLNIHSNDRMPLSDSLKQVVLIGTVNSIGVLTEQKNIDFGTLECESVDSATTIKVTNTGGATETIIPNISGSGATSYIIEPDSVSISPGSSQNFTVKFRPTGGGKSNAMVSFNALCKSDTTHLVGIKKAAGNLMGFPQQQLDFGNLGCEKGLTKGSIMTVKNIGSTTITLDSAKVIGSGFTLVYPKGTVTLEPDSSVNYILRFAPDTGGTYTGEFSVNGPCHIGIIRKLTGEKMNPKISVNKKSINYDSLGCNTSSGDSTVVIQNTGDITLTVTPAIVGNGFMVAPQSLTIVPGAQNSFKVRFQPTDTGYFVSKLIISPTGPCSIKPDTVALAGRKFSPPSCVVPFDTDTVFFETDCTGQNPVEKYVDIWNDCDEKVTLTSPKVIGKGFVLIDGGTQTLNPGDVGSYTVQFTPDTAGNYIGRFTVMGGPCNLATSVVLIGKCAGTSDVDNGDQKIMPHAFLLDQNFPNPFSRFSVVNYSLPENTEATFEVRDMLGRVVYRTQVNNLSTQLTVDASELSNGLYLYSLTNGLQKTSQRMMVVK